MRLKPVILAPPLASLSGGNRSGFSFEIETGSQRQIEASALGGNRSGFSFEIETDQVYIFDGGNSGWQPGRLLV